MNQSTKDMQLAQLNIAHMLAPIDSPQLKDFVDNLDFINGLAEQAPGFIWRLVTEEGSDATELEHPFGNDVIVNMSVWEDKDSLFNYVYKSQHKDIMARRKEWFHLPVEAHTVLWWIPTSTVPTVAEAHAKLEHLKQHGPTEHAFTFKSPFPPA